MKYLRLDLKVCEGCGVLWLRSGVENGVYCTTCITRLADFPKATDLHAGGRPRTSNRARAIRRCSARRHTGGAK